MATDAVLYTSSTQQYLALGKRCWVFFASLILIYTTSTRAFTTVCLSLFDPL